MSAEAKKPSLADITPAGAASRKVIITTLESVINCREAVIRLSQHPVGLRTAQRILELKQKIDEIGLVFGTRRDAIAAEKGTPTGENKWKLEPAQMEEFQAEIGKLLKEEVQVPQDVCITLADLNDARISAADLERLSFIVQDLA